MEIKCPSCGTPHRTEDHPGAFEINCVCGYAILLPDETERPAPANVSSQVPIALEQEDEELMIKVDEPMVIDPPNLPQSSSENLTPPEDLPRDMPYDPFELKNMESASFENSPPVTEIGEEISASGPQGAPISSGAAEALSAQAVVDRAQAASMGQFLGASYDLECLNLDREALVEISKRCEKLLNKRAWLQAELRRRHIDLSQLPDKPRLQNVPELLAVEIYLGSFELGGSCISHKKTVA